MKRDLQRIMNTLYKQYVKKKRWQKVVMALAAIVVFCTTYALVLPAITMETVCGMEEHTHGAACYANEDMEGLLICELEEHIHLEDCYEKEEVEEASAVNEEIVQDKEVVDEVADETVDNIVEEPVNETEEEPVESEVLPENNTSDSEDIYVEEDTEETLENSDELEEDTGIADNTDDSESTDNQGNNDETGQLPEVLEDSIQEESIDNATEEFDEAVESTEESVPASDAENKEESKKIVETKVFESEPEVLYGVMPTAEGDEITWELIPNANGSYTLKVSGNGAIPDNFIESVPELKENANNIADILIGRGITSIGQFAFYKMNYLEKVDFEEQSALTSIGGSAFAQCKALENVALQKCINLKIIHDPADGFPDNGTFANTALKNIQLPEHMEKIGINAFYNCDGLTNLYISNVKTISGSAFSNCSNLRTVEIANVEEIGSFCFYLSNNITDVILTNIDRTTDYAFKAVSSLTSLRLENVDFLGTGTFQYCSKLSEIEFIGTTRIGLFVFQHCTDLISLENANNITQIGMYGFANSLSKIQQFEYTKEMFPSLTRVETGVFADNKFEELTIGNLPLSNELFANSTNLEEVKFETNFNKTYDLFTGSTAKFKSIISSKVDEFYGENLKSISPYTSSLHFEGPSYLKITSPAGYNTGFPAPLNDLNGDYYADAQGVLYQLNADGTATLKYCPPQLATYNVATTIPKADGSGNYTVTSVDANAFALATDLSSLNEKTSKEYAATELNNIFNLADGNALSKESFANTALTGEIEGGDNPNQPEVPENPETPEIPLKGTVTDDILSYDVESYKGILSITTTDNGTYENTGCFTYYTGEMNQTSIKVSPQGVPNLENKVLRLYLKTSDPGLKFELETQADGETFIIANKEIKRKKLSDGSYYVDLPLITGENTFLFDFNFTYPSPTSPGGTAYLWGEILDKEVADIEAANLENGTQKVLPNENDSYHKMTWITREDQFVVEKTAGKIAKLTAVNDEALVSNLNFTISTTRVNEIQMQNIGENFVDTFEYIDTMTLTDGISWREGIVDAISAGNYTWVDNKINVTLDDGQIYTVAGYVQNNSNLMIEDFRAAINSEGNIEFSIVVKNVKKDSDGKLTESDTPTVSLHIGNNVLLADIEKLGTVTSVTVVNNVKQTPYYTFPKDSITTEANATAEISIRGGEVSLTKTHDRGNETLYWGEDINYTITLNNESVFNASGYGKVVDALDQYTYIKAENLQEMFDEDTENRLSVRITGATLYQKSETKTTGIAVDGKTSVTLMPQNTGVGVENYYNGTFDELDTIHMLSNGKATITFQWSNENLLEMCWDYENSAGKLITGNAEIGEGLTFSTIKDALDSIGYTITSQTSSIYTCTWDIENVVIGPGETLEYKIPATVKNTFMLLGKDLTSYHNQISNGRDIINNAVLQDEHGIQVESASTPPKKAYHEAILSKSASSDGKNLENGFDIKDGAVIEYSILIEHRGTSQYDVLPLVDHMQGGNVLLAKVSDNTGLDWITGLPVETIGTESYYVLNREGTYNKVKLGDFWASSVKVTKGTDGLDTLIHWYFKDTPKNTYTRKLSYKALVSRDYAGLESSGFFVNNEAWLNDHQSHRLYAPLFGGGSMLVADKKIYIAETNERVAYSMLDSDHTEVSYELTLENNGASSASIKGSKMYDALPNTFNSFIWQKDTNVNITYSNSEWVTNPGSWSIGDTAPEIETTKSGQQYICWGEDFKITVPARQKLTITVRLNFPTEVEWGKYFNACNGQLLFNTFHVYHMTAQVSHDLVGKSSAKLQKGVYDIGTMSYSMTHANERGTPYISTGTRHIYGNLTNRAHIVTYYVSLHNDGTNRLYLNDMIDVLPKGFNLLYVRTYADIGISGGLGRPYTMRGLNEPFTTVSELVDGAPAGAHMFSSVESNDIRYLQTNVTGTVIENVDGHRKIQFTFAGYDLDSSHYDSERKLYFLNPGEAIRFGYSVDTGFEVNSEDIAVNTIMMPFTDYTGQGLDTSKLEVNASNLNGLTPNDGDFEIITDEQAASYGVVRKDGDEHNQWLKSEVTVTRGKILPGIRKTAAQSNASITDEIRWNIQTYNDGTGPLNDYVITDEIDSPYKFLGEVSYEVYAAGDFANGSDGKPKPVTKSGTTATNRLFNISENHMDTGGNIKLIDCQGNAYVLTPAENYTKEFECQCLLWFENAQDRGYMQNTIRVRVSFEKTQNGNQRINIHFLGYASASVTMYKEYWGIPAGGHGNLSIAAVNQSGVYANKPYNNNAWITPVGLLDEFSPTPEHGNVTSLTIYGESRPSVVSVASVNVSSGFFTTAVKAVKEISDTNDNNETTSTGETNYILIDDKSSTFRYELEVNTPEEKDLTKFVLIDNLPEKGDHTTFGTAVSRNSEFNVGFAENPNITVKIDGKKITNYQIGYSSATTFNDSDWNGTSSWGSDVSTARSIRLVIDNTSLLKADSKIVLSFDAVIDDSSAMPGQIAWNTFGYHYEVIDTPGTAPIALEAAPLPVGIKFPSVPELTKELINKNDDPHIAGVDAAFRFLIYKGNSLRDLEKIVSNGDMISQIRNVLTANGITQYFLQDVIVPAGNSSSEVYKLNPAEWYLSEDGEWNIKNTEDSQYWLWEENAQYTIIELENANSEYEYNSMNSQYSRCYTFTYNPDKTERIAGANEYRVWKLELSKVDSINQDSLLADAVFALYSPNLADAELYNSDENIAALKNAFGISDTVVSKSVRVGTTAVTYYLKDIIQTKSGKTHLWEELMEETYVLQELRAPNGYNLDNTLHVVSRESDYHVEYTVTNEAGYALPESGGIGISGMTAGGAALVLMAAAGAVINNKKTSKNKRKVVSSDDSEGIKEAK